MSKLLLRKRRARSSVKTVTVDISDMKVSGNQGDILVTDSLGSSVGLTLYDNVAKVGGLIHCMLPLSKIDPENAATKPCMFVDTGVTALLTELFRRGAQRQNLVAKVAGAGSPLGREATFRIGQRNDAILRRLLWKNSIPIDAEDIGGSKARTMSLYLQDGLVTVKSEGKEVQL